MKRKREPVGRRRLYQEPSYVSVKMEKNLVEAMYTAVDAHVENVKDRTHLITVAVTQFLDRNHVPILPIGKKKGGA